MNLFKQLIVTVALVVFGTAAHADNYVPKDLGSPNVFTNTWTFLGVSDTAHVAGDTFKDFYVFNVPDAQNISVSLTGLLQSGSSGVSFLDGGFVVFSYSDGTPLYGVDATSSASVVGAPLRLDSGVYGLFVAGTYLVSGGAYGGQIFGSPLAAVPEPATVLMLLVGLALVAGVAQRRRRA